MKYVIVIVVILALSFLLGFVLGAVAGDIDAEEKEREDHDQMEYLRTWHEKHKRS
ncbi:MAG: hypothetical protein J6I76_01465 [Oribacterium sp.]|nr:hypothetical protein [Oribacterium sp.]